MSNKLIVFDWNGTLLADTRISWRAGNACFELYGRPGPDFETYRDTFTFPIIHFYKLNGLSVDDVLKRQDEANILFQQTYETLARRARLRKGARQVLDWIAGRRDLDCMILSNYRTERIKAHLERLKIAHYFDYVCAHNCDGTTILHNTTKAERLMAYMDKHGYRPLDTVIIGDSLEEPEIGRLLEITSIGITDGYVSEKRLRAAGPDHIISSLHEIKTLL